MTPVPPISSATVTADPSKSVNALVTPLSVRVIGNVAVVPVGISLATLMVKYPTGGSCLRVHPSAMSTVVSDTVTFVDVR